MAGEGRFIDGLMKGDLSASGRLDADNAKRVFIEKFENAGTMCAALGSAATVTSASLLNMGNGNVFLTTPVVGQTLIAPVITSTGLDVAGDQTEDDGREINFSGGITARSPKAYTVGAGAFYAKLKFSIEDVSGMDLCMFGFRKTEAHNADATAYTDFATLNVVSGDIKISTNLNSAGISTTDTTDNWADLGIHELGVFVDNDGVATFTIDGAAPTTTASVTLDSGDTMIPFFQFLQDAHLSGTVILQRFECGLQD